MLSPDASGKHLHYHGRVVSKSFILQLPANYFREAFRLRFTTLPDGLRGRQDDIKVILKAVSY
jgi:hypothetical protein